MPRDRMEGIRRWREEKDAGNRERRRLRDERGRLLALRIQGLTGLPVEWRPNFNLIVLTADQAEGWLSAQ